MNFRLRDYVLYPLAIKRHHDFLQQSQYWSPEKRRDWLQQQLDKTLRYAVKHVPYYKRTLAPFESNFNEMVDKLDLSQLPVITKDIIREHYKELQADNVKELRTHMDRTSGSTGAPMQFLLDSKSDIANFAAIWRILNWAGYKFGNRFASIIPNMEKKTHKEMIYDMRQNSLQFPLVNLRKEKIHQYVNSLRKFNPVFIKSYASSLALFAHWIKEAGIEDYRPKAVLTSAETLLDHQRKILTDALQCAIYDFYGQNERACLVSTCEKGVYHIHEEYSFVELVPEKNQVLIPSQPAQIIATTFDNFAMPFIRYQTNDMAIMNENAPCECGRTYKTVEKIIGRVDDVIYTLEGLQVARLDNAFKQSPGILEAQIVQQQIGKIQINMVKSANFQQSDLDNLLYRLNYRLGETMKINLNFVDEIPLGKNGKKKFIISDIKKESVLSNPARAIYTTNEMVD